MSESWNRKHPIGSRVIVRMEDGGQVLGRTIGLARDNRVSVRLDTAVVVNDYPIEQLEYPRPISELTKKSRYRRMRF